jgi:F0F1-type ATP synthase assembly protein I
MPNEGLGKYYAFAIRAMGELTVMIAAPAILAALAGKWLDNYFASGKLWFIILLVLAFVLTIIILPRKIRQYGQDYQKLFDKHGAGPTSR